MRLHTHTHSFPQLGWTERKQQPMPGKRKGCRVDLTAEQGRKIRE